MGHTVTSYQCWQHVYTAKVNTDLTAWVVMNFLPLRKASVMPSYKSVHTKVTDETLLK